MGDGPPLDAPVTNPAATNPAATISVLVAEDQVLLRRSLATLIDHEPDLCLAGEAADGEAAVAQARATRPDVVLMDIRMPGLDGLAATRLICADPDLAATRVCVLTMFELDEYVVEALRAGASAFVLKDLAPDDLLAVIRRVHAGEQCLAPSVLHRVIGSYLSHGGPRTTIPAPPEVLTPREVEVLTLVGRGFSNSEIEQALHISRGTMKAHISHLLTKLAARDRVQLVILAYECGLVGDTRP